MTNVKCTVTVRRKSTHPILSIFLDNWIMVQPDYLVKSQEKGRPKNSNRTYLNHLEQQALKIARGEIAEGDSPKDFVRLTAYVPEGWYNTQK